MNTRVTSALLALAVWLSAGSAPAQAAEKLAPSDLAILPLDDQTGPDAGQDHAWLRHGISRTLTRDLAQSKLARVVDARRIEVELSRAGKQAGGLSDAEQLAVGKALSASQVVGGALRPGASSDEVVVAFRLLSTVTGRSFAAAEGPVPLADPIPASRALMAELLTKARFAGVTDVALSALPAPSREVLMAVHRALTTKLAEPEKARAEFLKAARLSPVSARQVDELVEAFPNVRPAVLVLPVSASGAMPAGWPSAAQVALTFDLAALGLPAPQRAGPTPENTAWTAETAAAEARQQKADLAVLPSLTIVGGTARLQAQLVSAASGEVEATAAGAGGELPAAVRALEGAIALLLALDVDAASSTLLSSSPSAEVMMSAAERMKAEPTTPVAVLRRPRIESFDAVADSEGSAASVLEWEAVDVDRCALEGVGEVPPKGRRMVSPTQPTTYELVCEAGDNKMRAEAEVLPSRGFAWEPIAFWSAFAGASVGTVLTVGGFVFATFPAAAANQLHGLQLALPDGDDRDGVRAQRDQMALLANAGVGVAVVGAVVLVASVGALGVVTLVE